MMTKCVLAAVAVVISLGAGPAATRPVKPINGTRGIARLIPVALLPEPGQTWTELQQRNANEWAADHLRGLAIRVAGKSGKVSVSKSSGTVGVGVHEGFFADRGRQFMGSAGLVFQDPKTPGLADLREGDHLAASGRIKRVSLVMDRVHGAPATTVAIYVVLDAPELNPPR